MSGYRWSKSVGRRLSELVDASVGYSSDINRTSRVRTKSRIPGDMEHFGSKAVISRVLAAQGFGQITVCYGAVGKVLETR